MGYDDEAGRSRKRQNRGRQPVKRPDARTPEYRKNTEPRYEEPTYRESRYSDGRHRDNRSRDDKYRDDRYREELYRDDPYRYEEEFDREERYHNNQHRKHELGSDKKTPELSLITDSFKDDARYGRDTREENSQSRSRKSEKPVSGKPDSPGKTASKQASKQAAAAKQTGSGGYLTPEKKKAQKKKRKILIILLEVLILISVLLIAAYSYLSKSMNMMEKLPWNPDNIKNVEISAEKQEQMKGYWTIAVFGVDSRNSSVGEGNNSDVNIICNINQDTGEIKLVSVFRDSYLNINDKNSYNKINAAYLQGGPDQAVKALNKNLDLDIDDYVTFNWKAVADAINILGGVDLELSKAEFYYINAFVTETVKATGIPSEPVKHAGMVHLDGVQAVAYGRLRLMDTDFARTERQRKIISLAFEKAKKADWATVNNIIQTIFPQISTSVTLPEVLNMGRGIAKLHLGENTGFPMARGDANMGSSKGDCVIPQTLESNVKELHKFLFGDESYEPTNTVKTISKKIISDTGLVKEKKPVDHVDTDGGSIPKTTKESTKASNESSTAHESTKESDETDITRPTHETDSIGNVLKPIPKESGEETTKPGTAKPGTTEATRPTEAERPTEGESIPPRPGSGSGNNNSINAPGSSTDTGVILGPGMENSGSSSNNAPGSGSGNSNNNAPGSGQIQFNGPS